MRKLMIVLGMLFIVTCTNKQTDSANITFDSVIVSADRIKIDALIKNIKHTALVDTNLFITEDEFSFAAIYHQGDSVIALYVDSFRVTQELYTTTKDYRYTMKEYEVGKTILFPFWKKFEG